MAYFDEPEVRKRFRDELLSTLERKKGNPFYRGRYRDEYDRAVSDCRKVAESYDFSRLHIPYACGHLQDDFSYLLHKYSHGTVHLGLSERTEAYRKGVESCKSIVHSLKKQYMEKQARRTRIPSRQSCPDSRTR